ncbi:hypothetical protein HD806DRAFT_539273 [Xylariaceae sp. AK1471]|nr:hypothetical protein HD806DRAFT_539273 [Xylariaceae sp. AK1471]
MAERIAVETLRAFVRSVEKRYAPEQQSGSSTTAIYFPTAVMSVDDDVVSEYESNLQELY